MPKFDSNRFIDRQGTLASGTAVIYDQNFQVIKKITNVDAIGDYQDGIAFISRHEKQGFANKQYNMYIDVNGNQVFKSLTESFDAQNLCPTMANMLVLRPKCDGLVAFCQPKESFLQTLWGFRDANGRVVVPAKYTQVQDFSNGLAAVAIGSGFNIKWGFIDTKGNEVIPPKFSVQPSPFDKCGKALVRNKNNENMFINKQGEVVSEKYDGEHTQISPFYNGKAISYLMEYKDEFQNHRLYLVDSNYKHISAIAGEYGPHNKPHTQFHQYFGRDLFGHPDPERDRFATRYGHTIFKDNEIYYELYSDRLALLSDKGDIVMYGITGPFSEGLAPVANDKEAGYVNRQGEWIIKFVPNEF